MWWQMKGLWFDYLTRSMISPIRCCPSQTPRSLQAPPHQRPHGRDTPEKVLAEWLRQYCGFCSNRILIQAWHLNFSQLFDNLGHENHIFSESMSSRLTILTTIATWPPDHLTTWPPDPPHHPDHLRHWDHLDHLGHYDNPDWSKDLSIWIQNSHCLLCLLFPDWLLFYMHWRLIDYPLNLSSDDQFVFKQGSKTLNKWTSLVPEALPGAGAPSWQSHRQDRRSMWAGFLQQGGLGSTIQGGPPPPVVGLKSWFTKPC